MSHLEQIRKRIQGPVYSVITPFLPDDGIDYEALEAYLELIYQGGGRIFYVMGYNSRYSELSWDEIKTLNEFVARKVKEIDSDNMMILADPLHCPTAVSLEFARHAQDSGADIISIINREKFYSEDQIFEHYKIINDGSDIGILVHEMPFLSGYGGPPVNWPVSLLDRVADLPHVIAVKEDAKDDEYSREVIRKIRDRLSIVISGGGKRQWMRFADDGCQSWLNGIGVFDPRLAARFWEFYQAGETQKYMDIVDLIEVPFFEKGVKVYGWHLTIKAALEALGIMARHERMPLKALNEKDYQTVKELMSTLPVEKVVK